jgi:isopentenyl-diphosphate delta-isomerase
VKEEQVDILNEKGEKTGQVLLKSEAHKRGLWHGGAHLWIYNSDWEVLLQLRHPTKVIRPNIWDVSIAGHIAAGDSPKVTIKREGKEELGLDLDPTKFYFIGIKKAEERIQDGTNHRALNWSYITKQDIDLKTLKLEAGEVADVRWIPLDEFENDLKDEKKSKKYTPARIELFDEVTSYIKQLRDKNETNP